MTSAEKPAPLVIEARLNESTRRGANPSLPYGSDEIVAEALRAVEAGASIIHWHATDVDGDEHPGSVELYREVVERIRAVSDVVLHPTLGFMSTQNDAPSRVAHILELNRDPATTIDFVPVDFGAYGNDVWLDAERRFLTDSNFVLNRIGYLEELLVILRDNGVTLMPVVWSAGGLRTALAMRKKGLLPARSYWHFGFTGDAVPGGPPPTLANLQAFLDSAPRDEPWSVHVRDGDGMSMFAWAISLGGHIAVGLGDDPYARLGLPNNGELIARVADMAKTLGRSIATPAQTREIFGIQSRV
ncbi:beta-keto acid cleavage family enzyme [Microbacterium sp. GXF0217]